MKTVWGMGEVSSKCRREVGEIKFFTEKQDRGMIKLVVDLCFGGSKCIIHMLWGLIIESWS